MENFIWGWSREVTKPFQDSQSVFDTFLVLRTPITSCQLDSTHKEDGSEHSPKWTHLNSWQ